MTAEECLKIAKRLAKHPTQSTKHMEEGERTDGIEQMLKDLLALAHNDGCIAAAWAVEWIVENADTIERVRALLERWEESRTSEEPFIQWMHAGQTIASLRAALEGEGV
jgi:hypothetical protein